MYINILIGIPIKYLKLVVATEEHSTCLLRWQIIDMDKYLKYRCYYVATQ